MNKAFIGIDVCCKKGKRLPVSICTWQQGRLIPEALKKLPFAPPRGHGNAAVMNGRLVEEFVRGAEHYIVDACQALNLTPQRIAIDAPSRPRNESQPRRAAERAMDGAGIHCFTTPSAGEFKGIFDKVRAHLDGGGPENRIPHANQLWMVVGFRLFQVLKEVAECIEVFPQAIARVVGAGEVHKFKHGGVEAQLAAAAAHTGWPGGSPDEPEFQDIAYAPAHDRLDAYLSAWVAALDESDRIAFGEPPDDVIWVPRIERWKPPVAIPESRPRRSRSATKPVRHTARESRPCPACGYVFKRWPFGWDSHAAHKCGGLESSDPESRKAEFRRKYLQ